MSLLIGGLPMQKILVGTGTGVANAKRLMIGLGSSDFQAWVNAIPMGMEKTGTYQDISNSVWTQIVNWAPRSGFPLSIIANNGLVAGSSGLMAVTASLKLQTFRTGWQTSQARILVNGSVALTGVAVSDSDTYGVTGTISIQAGDTLTVEVLNTSAYGASYRRVDSGATTYLTLTSAA